MTESGWLSSDDPAAMLDCLLVRGERHTPPAFPAPSARKLRLFATACCRAVFDGVPCPACGGRGYYYPLNPIQQRGCTTCHGTGRALGLTDPRSRAAVLVAERHADGLAKEFEVEQARSDSRGVPCTEPTCLACMATECLNDSPWRTFTTSEWAINSIPLATQADLLRCLFGNPWRPVQWEWCHAGGRETLPGESHKPSRWWRPQWVQFGSLWESALGIARSIYDDRRWDWLPILADALEEARCQEKVTCPECDGSGEDQRVSTFGDCPSCRGTGRVPNPLLVHLRSGGPHARGCHVVDSVLGKS